MTTSSLHFVYIEHECRLRNGQKIVFDYMKARDMPCLDCKNHFVRVVAYNGVSNPELALVIPLSAVPANVFVYDNQTMPLLSLPNRIKTKEWIANVNARRAKGLRGCKLAV